MKTASSQIDIHGSQSMQISTEQRLRIACRAARIGIWQWDLNNDAMYYSDIAREICGFPADADITLDRVRDVTHPDDLNRTSAAASRALDPLLKENVQFVYRVIQENTGQVRWVEAFGEAQFAMVDGKETAVGYIGTLTDITDKKRTEDRLVEGEARLRLAIDAGQMAVWELNLGDNSIVGSPELNRLCGFPPDANPTLEELRGRYAPGERQRVEQEGAQARMRGLTKLQTIIKHLWPDGTEKWLLMRAQLSPVSSGNGEKVLGVLIDVTDAQRQKEQVATLAREMRHRLMNAFSVISFIAKSTWSGSAVPPNLLQDFQGRLTSLARVTDLLFSGTSDAVSLTRLITTVVDPYQISSAKRFDLRGQDVLLPRETADAIGMGLHELCTNAIKHGALSVPTGHIEISWTLMDDMLHIHWRERGGPVVQVPKRHGLGTKLLLNGLFTAPNSIDLRYDPSGVQCDFGLKMLAEPPVTGLAKN